MNIILIFLISFLHAFYGYIHFTLIIISNNIKLLFILLCIAIAVKISYTIHGRCILTKYEENKYFYPIFTYFSDILLYDLSYKKREEILVNSGLLLVLYKLFVLIILKYYNIVIK
jgi:hypothetical protein